MTGLRYRFQWNQVSISGIKKTYCLHSVQTASGEPNKLIFIAVHDLILGEKLSELEANSTPQPSSEVTIALQSDNMIKHNGSFAAYLLLQL